MFVRHGFVSSVCSYTCPWDQRSSFCSGTCRTTGSVSIFQFVSFNTGEEHFFLFRRKTNIQISPKSFSTRRCLFLWFWQMPARFQRVFRGCRTRPNVLLDDRRHILLESESECSLVLFDAIKSCLIREVESLTLAYWAEFSAKHTYMASIIQCLMQHVTQTYRDGFRKVVRGVQHKKSRD